MSCFQEECPNWSGDGCPCALFDIDPCKCAYPDDADPAAHIGCPVHGGESL